MSMVIGIQRGREIGVDGRSQLWVRGDILFWPFSALFFKIQGFGPDQADRGGGMRLPGTPAAGHGVPCATVAPSAALGAEP